MRGKPIRTVIKKQGQRYLDEPVYIAPKPVAASVMRALRGTKPKNIFSHYERVALIWK